jgi:hypothetical protein
MTRQTRASSNPAKENKKRQENKKWKENKKWQLQAREQYPATRGSKGRISASNVFPDKTSKSPLVTMPGIERAMKFGHYYLEGVVSSVKKHTMEDALKSRYEARDLIF